MLSEDHEDLTCPISRELLQDPIVVPCCGRAFSRESLHTYFGHASEKTCPCCRADLSEFDEQQAPKNVNLASLVEMVSQEKPSVEGTLSSNTNEPRAKFGAEAEHLVDSDDHDIGVAELKISVNDSTLNPKPTLFIVLADVSGSMQGRPWQQVCASLKHIAHQSFENPAVICRMVAYESSAKEIDMSGSLTQIIGRIEKAFTGGGTDFASAFTTACSIIKRESGNQGAGADELPFGHVVIAFLTDGQDQSCVGKPGGIDYLRRELDKVYRGDYVVHTVGFDNNHNLELLDAIRKVGTMEGAYRYANYDDNDDVICGKLTSIFDTVSSSSTISAEITLPEGMSILYGNSGGNDSKQSGQNTFIVNIPVNQSGQGSITRYITCVPESDKTVQAELRVSGRDPIQLNILQTRCPQRLRLRSLQKLATHHVDQLAAQALYLASVDKKQYGDTLFAFHCELLIRCAASLKGLDQLLTDKLTVIEAELQKIKLGQAVNKNVLNDLKFSSMFIVKQAPEAEVKTKKERNRTVQPPKFKSAASGGNGQISKYNIKKIHYVHGKKLFSKLHTAVVQQKSSEFENYFVQENCIALINEKDRDGNTALHLACMKGHVNAVKILVSQGADLTITNKDNLTALDLAIMAGYDRCVTLLLDHNAPTAASNDQLMTYVFDRHFFRTATILLNRKVCRITNEIRNFVDGKCYDWIEQRESASVSNEFLDMAIRKGNVELFEKCVQSGITPDVYHMYLAMDYGQLGIFKTLAKTLNVNDIVGYEGNYESLLFVAASTGKLDYVKVLLEHEADMDWRNVNGNNALWIACCNNRIDVVEALLEAGADPNTQNNDGVVPLISCAQRGSFEIAEILMNYGAQVNIPNKNGDNPLIIACRTGQAEILELFLTKATEEDLQYCAKIDGFNPMFSAAEQDRAECILTLHRYGATVKCRTRPDNQIIPYATPLHLTALYGCANAAKVLLDLGAEIEAQDMAGMTPLHVAMLRGNLEVVKLLISRNANMFALDNAGNMPGAYCQDINPDILVDPLYPFLVRISHGDYGLLESKFIDLLRKHGVLPGFLQPGEITNLRGLTAGCALIEAVIHGNVNAAKALVELGAESSIKDSFGMTARDWAEVIGGMMKNIIPGSPNAEIMNRLSLITGKDKQLVTLIGKPPQRGDLEIVTPRIDEFFEPSSETHEITVVEPLKICDHPKWVGGKNVFQNEIFHIKRQIIGHIASGSSISPRTWAILYLIAGDTAAINIYNSAPQSFNFEETPKFEGESFIFESKVDRTKFEPGSIICWNRFVVSNLNWSIPKQGTLFLIKSKKHGARVAQKVVFGTNAKFKVTHWYKADSTCIAQKNIRVSCFKIDDTDNKFRLTDSPIIIELEEIEE
ncbi:hypothetical protein C9374_005351 [Naegleria lovaniensis]|uniref:VWFA domain-containing protein n=1 Tax=Naegleria lovaniensis TaxID=51637 RepID=A0AA88GNA7_NAELO|nr:uncharacterized protein C9374_005351 [Naegleria lovaniensis]KAG2382149.1 hypothetical protein C9374_005351 [Naegleria lovaniensis]